MVQLLEGVLVDLMPFDLLDKRDDRNARLQRFRQGRDEESGGRAVLRGDDGDSPRHASIPPQRPRSVGKDGSGRALPTLPPTVFGRVLGLRGLTVGVAGVPFLLLLWARGPP